MEFDEYEERLLAGSSLNVVGLSGSGRSSWLTRFWQHLERGGWSCVLWRLDDLRASEKAEMKAAVRSLSTGEMPVLLIDDFGQFLMEAGGPWLERLLFSAVHEREENEDSLRVVLVTSPRDREIVGPASLLRERCHVIVPTPPDPSEEQLRLLGCANRSDVEELTGLSTHLIPGSGRTPEEERGLLMSRCREQLPFLVGELDGALQRRLGTVLRRTAPSRWRPDDGDRSLRPLAVSVHADDHPICRIPIVVDVEELAALLLSERWPECDLRRSARRFAARCGNDPAPIWTDNYLSDTELLDFSSLAEFLAGVMKYRPVGTKLRLLSRDFVGGESVNPHDLGAALLAGGLGPDVAARLEWRIYDRRAEGNLHQRELSLPRRGVGFSLPIATMIVGQEPLGNESDAELPLYENSPAQRTWGGARPVPLGS